eukprot:6659505-Pyramimonas_sp.AAC.1
MKSARDANALANIPSNSGATGVDATGGFPGVSYPSPALTALIKHGLVGCYTWVGNSRGGYVGQGGVLGGGVRAGYCQVGGWRARVFAVVRSEEGLECGLPRAGGGGGRHVGAGAAGECGVVAGGELGGGDCGAHDGPPPGRGAQRGGGHGGHAAAAGAACASSLGLGYAAGGRSSQLPSAGPRALSTTPTGCEYSVYVVYVGAAPAAAADPLQDAAQAGGGGGEGGAAARAPRARPEAQGDVGLAGLPQAAGRAHPPGKAPRAAQRRRARHVVRHAR